MVKSVFKDTSYINEKKITKICEKYEYVSFDIFDTLIKRNVELPNIIFEILDDIAQKNNINNFKKIRKDAEIEIRNIQSFATIYEIYKIIETKIGEKNSKLMLNKEIEVEKSYCTSNFEVVNLLNDLREKGKKIIAISDMYLTSDIILDILIENSIIVDKIYVSCECKAKKRTGELFDYVLKELNIKPQNIIHIGDNIKADFLGATISKIKPIHIKQKKEYFNINKFKAKISNKNNFSAFQSVINNNMLILNDYYEQFGFAYLGPLLYNYCYWLKEECDKNKLNKVYFFARDGFMLKKVFDLMFPNEFETHYVYLSRRAIRIPFSTINMDYNEFIKYFPRTKYFTISVLLENFGLKPSKYNQILEKYKLSKDDLLYYDDLLNKPIYKELFLDLKTDIEQEANKEMQILKKYLEQEKFYGKIAIVDVGWHNSIQFYLEKIFEQEKIDVEMYGLYLGLQSGERKVKYSKSFIRESIDNKYVDSIKSFIGLIESLFLENEGSTIKFTENKGKVVPVKLDYEYNESDVECLSLLKVRNGAIKFIEETNHLENFQKFRLNGYDAYLPLKTFGINPYLYDIKRFTKFRYFAEDISYFSNSKGMIGYIKNPKLFKKEFLTARWKIAFMKETFKVNIPYFKIYKAYKKKKGWY